MFHKKSRGLRRLYKFRGYYTVINVNGGVLNGGLNNPLISTGASGRVG
jgi:hypothetical protein